MPISASAPNLKAAPIKPVAKVEPLDFKTEDQLPSTSSSNSPIEKENQPLKTEFMEVDEKKPAADEDDGDYSEEFEREDQATREPSTDKTHSRMPHFFKDVDAEKDAHVKQKSLEIPAYSFVQTMKFRSNRTCARTYLCYTADEPDYWRKRRERKELEKKQQQMGNNKPAPPQHPQPPAQNAATIIPNPNLARTPQTAAATPATLLQKAPNHVELPQGADQALAFMSQIQARMPMSAAPMMPPTATPIPAFPPVPSMSPFDPRFGLGFPNNPQMQMMMQYMQQIEQQV